MARPRRTARMATWTHRRHRVVAAAAAAAAAADVAAAAGGQRPPTMRIQLSPLQSWRTRMSRMIHSACHCCSQLPWWPTRICSWWSRHARCSLQEGGKSGRAVEKTHRDSVNKMAKMVRPLYGRQCLMSLVNEPQTEPNCQPKARQAS